MKKYKLKRTYPTLPNWMEKGDIVEEIEDKRYTRYDYRVTKTFRGDSTFWENRFRKKEVENYPEFWEKVEEKNYKILSFTNKGVEGYVLDYPLYKLQPNGLYKYLKSHIASSAPHYTKERLLENETEIYSVKRLSDEEVFTIGDRVKASNNVEFTIKGIDFSGRELLIYSAIAGHTIGSVKKHLFTTEDGVNIYEEDNCFCVKEHLGKYKYCGRVSWTMNHPREHLLYFATKRRAKQFVKDHNSKSLFTTNDGVRVHKGDVYYMVRKRTDYSIDKARAHDQSGKQPDRYKYFFHKENAEKWADNYKPKFSKANLRKAVEDISMIIYGTTNIVDKCTGGNLPDDLVNALIEKMESYEKV